MKPNPGRGAPHIGRQSVVSLPKTARGARFHSVGLAEGAKEQDTRELRAGELWPWLWLILVVCWLAEGVLANRTVA